MLKFNQLLRQVAKQSSLNINVDRNGSRIEIIFPNERRQWINVERTDERYVLTSVVLGRKQVDQIGRVEVLPRLWQRNRETNVVAFSLNKQGQLVGCIEQLAATIDAAELALYLELLARECDLFEYTLTGQDRQ